MSSEMPSEMTSEMPSEIDKPMTNKIIKTINTQLTDCDLFRNKNAYSIAELEASVDNLSVKYLLNYQILNAEFCAKYILTDYCATCNEDTYICNGDVLNKQKHITREELAEACKFLEKT